jgi:single-stranded-DNA-specific exonuclease
MNWQKTTIDPDEVRSLSTKYNINLLAASIFARRGISGSDEMRYFLEEDSIFLHNPFRFTQMERVVERISQAREEGEKVKIFGDRDADGITSTVLIKEELESMGINTAWALPSGDDPYGLTIDEVDRFAAVDGTLFITVDCGISNFEEIAYANDKGIDTIVIDHHNPSEILPDAYAIINPKISDSGYPFRELAGCGVVAKVIWALRFAQTPLFNRTICLLNVKPGNESYILEAALLVNLVEIDRITETLVPGMLDLERTRLASFLVGKEVVVYEATAQEDMLRALWGENAEIGLQDLTSELWKFFPEMKGNSLLKLREQNRPSLYGADQESEINILIQLYTLCTFKTFSSLSEDYLQILDLVALGTLADLMPLRNENRILVRIGMDVMNGTRRKGLQALLFRQNLSGKRIDSTDIGWQVSPLINATGRLGVPERAAELLMGSDNAKIEKLVTEILDLNKERKKLGDKVWEKILPEARESFDNQNGKLIQVGGADIHRGITGIIASKLVKYFHVPALVVSILDDKAVGSARSAKGFNIKEFLDKCSDIFTDYGGHDYAAGYSMPLEKYELFQTRLSELTEHVEDFISADDSLVIDAEVPSRYMTPKLLDLVDFFAPFGEANPPLVFMNREARIGQLEIIGKKEKSHVRLLIETGTYKWPAVYWNAAERVNRDFTLHDMVEVVFRIGRNFYQNRESPQLTILDIKRK